ncbi:hypothetical protein [Marinobacter xestospongiae]|uniref:Type IV pili methyl-accepting chemotaxis transducer N-term n=1 Tax=Marinobacter xestospongiae TaxID=994319 RepID=A0ABU3VYG6_9GAMM|nr:hypothetical protein [Marinobacter xestospongiae]MDV2079333.1 hypothetical protein [Marinobacter xestospongiae]
MKAKHPLYRSLAALLLFFTVLSPAARADDSASFLDNLHHFRVSNFIALDAYYRFSVDGDTVALNEIVASINQANGAMNTVANSTADMLDSAEIASLQESFDKFKDLMRLNINDVRKNGYPDLRLVSEMANQAAALSTRSTELYSVALENAQVSANERIEAARSAAVTMAQMMAKYSVRSNMAVSQTFQGSSEEEPLDVKAQKFEQLLTRLSAGPAPDSLRTMLDELNSKWLFIRNSYINYNENNVSFVIDRYSKGILEGLDNTINLLKENA